MYFDSKKPKLIAFELTSKCNLLCKHCRGSSVMKLSNKELTKKQIFDLLDQMSEFGSPIVILTGGEPLLNTWIYDIISYGTSKNLIMTLASNGTLITNEIAIKLKKSGIKRVSISLDGIQCIHDDFRSVKGCFDLALNGIQNLKKNNIEFQINTTISKRNILYINEIHQFVLQLGAVAHHFFFLVPTGRATTLKGDELSPQEYEKVLIWLYRKSIQSIIHIHPTCVPHYFRIKNTLDLKKEFLDNTVKYSDNNKNDQVIQSMCSQTRGCLGGISFVFVSSTGNVNPCGYLPLSCGNIKKKSLSEIWNSSIIFQKLRNPNNYHGKCGTCKFKYMCGGCRARAYAATGDFLGEEPFCLYNLENK